MEFVNGDAIGILITLISMDSIFALNVIDKSFRQFKYTKLFFEIMWKIDWLVLYFICDSGFVSFCNDYELINSVF